MSRSHTIWRVYQLQSIGAIEWFELSYYDQPFVNVLLINLGLIISYQVHPLLFVPLLLELLHGLKSLPLLLLQLQDLLDADLVLPIPVARGQHHRLVEEVVDGEQQLLLLLDDVAHLLKFLLRVNQSNALARIHFEA